MSLDASNGQPGSKPVQAMTNVVAMLRNGQRFVFLYDDASVPQALQTLGRYAADPELAFSWQDAATLARSIRRQTEARA